MILVPIPCHSRRWPPCISLWCPQGPGSSWPDRSHCWCLHWSHWLWGHLEGRGRESAREKARETGKNYINDRDDCQCSDPSTTWFFTSISAYQWRLLRGGQNGANGMASNWKPWKTYVWCIWYHSTDSTPAITTSSSSPIKVPPTSCDAYGQSHNNQQWHTHW